jgi:hypothetical protein
MTQKVLLSNAIHKYYHLTVMMLFTAGKAHMRSKWLSHHHILLCSFQIGDLSCSSVARCLCCMKLTSNEKKLSVC